MATQVGIRTFEDDNSGLVVVNELAASTSEAIDSEIKKLLQVSIYSWPGGLLPTISHNVSCRVFCSPLSLCTGIVRTCKKHLENF